MTVDWPALYNTEGPKRSKFDSILPPPEWDRDYQANIRITAEWLWRNGKKSEIILMEEDLLQPTRDNWFNTSLDDGEFIHVCYPDEMIKFRRQYETLWANINFLLGEGTDGACGSLALIRNQSSNAKGLLWSGWKCLGFDGKYTPIVYTDEKTEIQPLEWKPVWTYRCSRCAAKLPKSLEMWTRLKNTEFHLG